MLLGGVACGMARLLRIELTLALRKQEDFRRLVGKGNANPAAVGWREGRVVVDSGGGGWCHGRPRSECRPWPVVRGANVAVAITEASDIRCQGEPPSEGSWDIRRGQARQLAAKVLYSNFRET